MRSFQKRQAKAFADSLRNMEQPDNAMPADVSFDVALLNIKKMF